jgi:hypothetical protein
MAAGRDPHQFDQTGSGLVPYRDVSTRVYAAPLLPYERDLIATIGCSEEEYQWYKQQIANLSKERPAEYAHIPNIENEASLIIAIVSLVIGLATSAISMLTAPSAPETTRSRDRRLSNAQGRSRFNQTFGFEGNPDIAEFGLPIPIMFGRYQERLTHTTGGVMTSPALVWSRMFSYGSNQGYKGLYVIGESSLNRPDVNGIFLGTMPLASLPEQQYAFYWASRQGNNRVLSSDLFAGTRGEPFSGDPEPYDDVFQCPTQLAVIDTGFSSVYTPTGSTAFGVYDAIKNGTHNKINWQIISIPKARDPNERLRATRRKIAGGAASGLRDGMPGLGAGYSCFMGLVRHNATEYELPTLVTVQVNDTVEFRIRDRAYTNEIFNPDESGVTLDDENARVVSEREEADDKLQVGEMFMIGRSVWQVIQRPDTKWAKDDGDASYILKCLDLTGGINKIGIAGRRAITEPIGYDGAVYTAQWVDASHFPLLRVAFATVRNQRAVDTTEFGIKSEVWNRANGLCNFPVVPKPAELAQADEDDVNITTGVRNGYFARTSVFTIALRPVGLDTNGKPFPWELLGEQFCVTGQTPGSKYNYIRINSSTPGQYEYRFIPKCGAEIRNFSPNSAEFWRLNASSKQINGANYSNRYGTFRVVTTGDVVAAIDVRSNAELRTEGIPEGPGTWNKYASRLIVEEWLPSNQVGGKFGGWHTHYLGLASDFKGEERSVEIVLTWKRGGRGVAAQTMRVQLTAVSAYTPENQFDDWGWTNSTLDIIYLGWSNDEPPENYTFDAQVRVDNRFNNGVTGPKLKVIHDNVYTPGKPAEAAREFEAESQIGDVSYYQEIDKSNTSNPEHEIVYVNESVTNPERPTYESMTMFGMALRSSRSITSLDQVRVWVPDGVSTFRFAQSSVGPANKFSDLVYFLLTDPRAGVGRRVTGELIDTAGFYRTSNFLVQNEIYFDGVLEEKTNIRQFISQMAPLHLCSFVIANGKFTVEPALPTETDGTLRQSAVPISALFTAGNIIEESFAVNYIEANERQNFRAVMTYREGEKNQLPENRSMMVQWADSSDEFQQANMETYDLSSFCTYRSQAFLTARFLLSIRRRVTHAISFKTTPEGLYLAPGQYIRVITKASPNVSFQNGVVDATGAVTSLSGELSGTYDIFAYRAGDTDVRSTTITVTNGTTSDRSLFGALFTVRSSVTNCNIYQVEQISMDEDGLVEVQATHFPCDSNLRSIIVQDVLDASRFTVID